MQPQADIERKVAYEEWKARRENLGDVLNAFKAASADPRLVERHSSRFSDVPETDILSFDSLCKELEHDSAFFSFHGHTLQRVEADIKTIRNNASIFVPIQRLPHEILRYIITSAAQTHLDRWPYHISFSDRQCLSLVCRLWSRICQSANILWMAIDFADGPFFEGTLASVHKSGSRGLYVRLDFDALLSRNYFDVALEELAHVIPRIERLDAVGRSVYKPTRSGGALVKLMSAFNGVPSHNSALRMISMQIYCIEVAEASFQDISFEFFRRMLSLRELDIRHCKIDWASDNIRNLTILRLRYLTSPSGEQLDALLRRCPGLKELELHYDQFPELQLEPSYYSNRNPCVFPDLVIMELARIDLSLHHHIFAIVRAPRLQHLCLNAFALRPTHCWAEFAQTSPMMSHIEILDYFRGADPFTNERVEFISVFPNIHHLHFQGGMAPDTLFQSMSPMEHGLPTAERKVICSQLVEL